MIVEQSKRKCAHEGCTCEVYTGQTYCGPHCAAAADADVPSDQPCGCGHEHCQPVARGPEL